MNEFNKLRRMMQPNARPHSLAEARPEKLPNPAKGSGGSKSVLCQQPVRCSCKEQQQYYRNHAAVQFSTSQSSRKVQPSRLTLFCPGLELDGIPDHSKLWQPCILWLTIDIPIFRLPKDDSQKDSQHRPAKDHASTSMLTSTKARVCAVVTM